MMLAWLLFMGFCHECPGELPGIVVCLSHCRHRFV